MITYDDEWSIDKVNHEFNKEGPNGLICQPLSGTEVVLVPTN